MMVFRRFVLTFSLVSLVPAASLAAQCSGGPPPRPDAPSLIGGGAPPVGGPGDTVPRNPSAGNPSSPGAPGPATPGTGTPRRGGPTTGGPARGGKTGPGGPTTGGPGAPAGAPIEFRRGKTSKDVLEIEWDYPMSQDGSGQALSRERAFEAIAGVDPRPLLVIRECHKCQGTERALLRPNADNERIRLMTRWFHCVRLPNNVWEPRHPYFHVFDGMGTAHLFLASRDHELVIPFDGVQSQSMLWSGMRKVLGAEYRKDAKGAVAKLVKHLDEYDKIDAKVVDALAQFDRALENHGPKSGRFKKAKQRLEKHRANLVLAKTREKALSRLGLKGSKAKLGIEPKKD